MKEIPTAKQFALSFTKEHGMDDTWLETLMVEFTKLHVTESLEQASKLAKEEHYDCENDHRIYDNYQILNAYPLKNIK